MPINRSRSNGKVSKVPGKAKPGSLLEKVRASIQKSSEGRVGMFYVRTNEKRRIRFLEDFEAGRHVVWHTKWTNNQAEIDTPCLTLWGKECPFCGASEVKSQDRYAWQVYDYESGQVRIFCYAANKNSPLPQLSEMADSYNTILTRDFEVKKLGERQNSTHTVTAGDPSRFRMKDTVKPMSEKKFLALLAAAYVTGDLDDYPDAESDYEEDEDEEGEGYEDEESDDSEDDEDEAEYEEEDDEDDDYEEEEKPARRRKPVKAKAAVKRRSSRR